MPEEKSSPQQWGHVGQGSEVKTAGHDGHVCHLHHSIHLSESFSANAGSFTRILSSSEAKAGKATLFFFLHHISHIAG
jgi:hypothetical protein